MDDEETKEKVLFVSYNTGTSTSEILLFLSCVVQCSLLYSNLTLFAATKSSQNFKAWRFIISNGIFVVMFILMTTLLADYLILLFVLLVSINVCSVAALSPGISWSTWINWVNVHPISGHIFITNYKAMVQQLTCLCILAVDFRIFPRRFAKTEVYGIGLMDLAVGIMIFSNALTSTMTRYGKNHFLRIVKSVSVLLFLGCCRLFLLRHSNYQEHVTEYGVHWNFFFTIAAVQLLSYLILAPFSTQLKQPLFLCISLLIITAYQYALFTNLTELIQNGFYGDNLRSNFLDANREGLFACIGCTSIYFIGLFIGRQIFRKHKKAIDLMKWFLIWFLFALGVLQFVVYYIAPISRQMANLSYFIFQIVIHCWTLIGLILNDIIHENLQGLLKKKFLNNKLVLDNLSMCEVPYICQAVSKNQLVYFLTANVFTGLINLSINTLKVNALSAFSVLCIYMFVMSNFIGIFSNEL